MELSIDLSSAEIAKLFETTYKEELAVIQSGITSTYSAIEELEESLEKNNVDLADRNRITDNHVERINKLSEALSAARDRHSASLEKGSLLLDIEEETIRALRGKRRNLEDLERDLNSASTHGLDPSPSVFDNMARVIKSVEPFLSRSDDIMIGPNLFKFTTAPVYIKDRDGSTLKPCFGKFSIDMRIVNNRFQGTFRSIDPIFAHNESGGYFHPHVEANGKPCLGNAQAMLFNALKEGAFGHAVSVVWEFLTTYNIESPYAILSSWTPCKWHTSRCDCGLVLAPQCGCEGCVSCNRVVVGPCGSCTSCCANLHGTLPQALRRQGLGIQGSECSVSNFIFDPSLANSLSTSSTQQFTSLETYSSTNQENTNV